MTTRLVVGAVSAAALLLSLAGCGSGVGTGNRSVAADSQACIDCHLTQRATSKVTEGNIVEEWQRSRHAFMNAAGCNDCHETSAMHGGDKNTCANCHGGGGSKPIVPADANGKCAKCHGLNFPEDLMVAEAPQHFGNMTASSVNRFVNFNRASYLSSQYAGKCRKCHNPHDPTTGIEYNKFWAAGGMGDVATGARGAATAVAAGGRDFKMFGTPVPANKAFIYATGLSVANGSTNNNGFTPGCVRCHTTTGYINFVNSGFMGLNTFGNTLGGAYTDKTKEVTACDACHDEDYNFRKVRQVPAARIYFNYSAISGGIKVQDVATQYPDFGASNTCVPCHSGRGEGAIIKRLAAIGLNFTNSASPSGHDFTGAGTIAGLSGYQYNGKNYTDSAHDNIGMSSGGGQSKGPCVTCHMNTANRPQSHLFMTVEHGTRFETYTTGTLWPYSVSATGIASLQVNELLSRTCSNFACHVGPGTSVVSLDSLNEDKLGYISALTVLNRWLAQARAVTTNNATNWEFFGAGSGPDTMGANFNLGLLNNEPGGYAHRPVYVKRLIFDSIAHLAQLSFPAKDADAVINAVKGVGHGQTAVAASRRLPPEITTNARNWLFGRYTSSSATSSFRARRPGD